MARSRTTWTPDQARQIGAIGRIKAAAARRHRAETSHAVKVAAKDDSASDPWLDLIHTRTRQEVAGVLDLVSEERKRGRPDGQRLNWLAAALERLAELERVLDGRPGPGTLKPRANDAGSAQTRRHAAPIAPKPAPSEPTHSQQPTTVTPEPGKESL